MAFRSSLRIVRTLMFDAFVTKGKTMVLAICYIRKHASLLVMIVVVKTLKKLVCMCKLPYCCFLSWPKYWYKSIPNLNPNIH
jgi:hypothetical protein